MNKKSRILIILGTLLLFVGCSFATEDISSEVDAQKDSLDGQEENIDANENPLDCEKKYNLVMATDASGFSQIRGNQNGAYFLWSTGEGHQVLYVNYSTKDLTAWTNQLNPTQDETNPGMIMDAFGGTKPYVTEDNVYVMKFGKLPLPSVGFPGSPCKLSKLSLNAAGRRTITLPSNQIILQNSGVAAEEDKLYLLVGTYDETGERESCDVCYADFTKEKLVSIATLEEPGQYYLVGVYDQGFLLQRTTVPAEYEKKSHREQVENYRYDLELFSLADGTLTKGKSWKTGELSCVYSKGGIYYIDKNSGSLNWYDAKENQDHTLFENIVPEGHGDQALYLYGEDYGDHLYAHLYGEDGIMMPVGIDLQNGNCTPITLEYEYNTGTMPVSIVAQTTNQFLVEVGQTECIANMVDPSGKIHETVQSVPKYALIDKEDYWASRPNYEMIEDHYFKSSQ